MATKAFKTESPFEKILTRTHDESDFKYTNYTKYISSQAGVSTSPVSLALFGLGRAGSIHLSNILASPRVNLKYIVEEDQSRWEPSKIRWNLTNTTFIHPNDVAQVYADPDLHACLIATPTFTHEGFIIGSLEGGKAVFSEKPISQEPSGTARCYQKADSVGKPLFCAFNRRFDPSFGNVRDRVRAGDLGHVHMIKTTSRDSPLPSIAYLKISGGIFHDCAVHDIDMITWILGEYPTEVFSAANSHIPEIKAIDDWDNVAITMKFPSGTLATVDLSRFANYGYDQRLEVFGPKGMLHVKNETPNKTVFSDSCGSSEVPMYYSFPSRHADGYMRELDHFLDVVQGKCEMSVTDRMTSAVSKIADACEESAKTARAVQLSWKEDELPQGYLKLAD
eukprot:TRINITY_DN46780_c0_g1_i1.p1 TRINITY_DN46780_c0_g1~~TRINITY_DN46780_c0_g1_i1.p1  ORF type:complete len:423 (+),score=101.34 TRINITY_DN46780_c0_g1_i1:92-1270(+)